MYSEFASVCIVNKTGKSHKAATKLILSIDWPILNEQKQSTDLKIYALRNKSPYIFYKQSALPVLYDISYNLDMPLDSARFPHVTLQICSLYLLKPTFPLEPSYQHWNQVFCHMNKTYKFTRRPSVYDQYAAHDQELNLKFVNSYFCYIKDIFTTLT